VDKLRPVLRRDFPDFEPQHVFEAALPVYFVRLSVEVLEPQELTSFQAYMLHAIALEVNTPQEIAHLLGVDPRDITAPGTGLLQMDFIEQGEPIPGKGRRLSLTEKGLQAFSTQGAPPIPKRKVGQFHYNALTQTAIPLEEKTFSVEQMQKKGSFILPVEDQKRPTLGHFTEKVIGEVLSASPGFRDNDIVALLELRKIELEYISPVDVVLLQHTQTGEQRLVIYRNSMLQRAESAVVQRFFDEGMLRLPIDATPLNKQDISLPSTLPPLAAHMTKTLLQSEYDVEDLEVRVTLQQELLTATQSNRERQELTNRLHDLKEELRIKREEMERLRVGLLQNQVEFLQTEQHRPVLERALREATQELIIISPWMNRRACNDTFCQLVAAAVKRGVKVRLGYGIGNEPSAVERERNQMLVHSVQNALSRVIPETAKHLLEIVKTKGTHQKILICDRAFAVTGSFNWLSYLGEQDEGYRNELGTLFRRSHEIAEIVSIAQNVLASRG